ncbi:threonine synthase [Luteithermobacter gelatinilyticus]|uniref:threonine synthase n=1 Tax=Luteithermobacter gelatinilyticus TaxID=2582913 RepID=UPI001106F2DC|nr:threonine synthase [Luteithermobacter gelatinilyticus]
MSRQPSRLPFQSPEQEYLRRLYTSASACAHHLECSLSGERYDIGRPHGLSRTGKPLMVRYDLDKVNRSVTWAQMKARRSGFWKYRELLPVMNGENVISLGEGVTPLIALRYSVPAGARVVVKDEGRLPTGSFKARGLAVAVGRARELGLRHLAMPTNGNAGAALAAYARYAGLKATIFCPEDTPEINLREMAAQGAELHKVNGLIHECGRIVQKGVEESGWADFSTLKEPYRLEGKKTMGLELAEQYGGTLPEVIFYPTGGGTGLIGMWKAFQELVALGWIRDKLPRMVAVQATGCAPIVRAWEQGWDQASLWRDAATVAAGIRVPVAVGDFLILRALRESGGFATAVSDQQILKARDQVAREDGLLLCPEGAATFAAWKQALEQGMVSFQDQVILFNCATGLKYPLPEGGSCSDCDHP